MLNKIKSFLLVFALISTSLTLSSCRSSSSSDPAENANGTLESGNEDHIVGSDAASYYEKEDVNNSSSSKSENVGYTLDKVGLVIHGTFADSAGSVSNDFYKFNTGTFSKINVQVYVDGKKETEANHLTTISLNAAVDDGYSTLMGNGYFIRGWIQPSKEWLLNILPPTGTPASQSYTIELIGVD